MDHGNGVLEGLFGHDLARTDPSRKRSITTRPDS